MLTETIWPIRPKIFSTWHFTKNVHQAQILGLHSRFTERNLYLTRSSGDAYISTAPDNAYNAGAADRLQRNTARTRHTLR